MEQPTHRADAPDAQVQAGLSAEEGVNQALAIGLAQWLGRLRQVAPGMSLASLEVFLWVASGVDSADGVHAQMMAASPLARQTVTRALGLLRGRGQWRSDHWVRPFDWLEGRPHPHVARAIAHRVSREGRQILAWLSTLVLPS